MFVLVSYNHLFTILSSEKFGNATVTIFYPENREESLYKFALLFCLQQTNDLADRQFISMYLYLLGCVYLCLSVLSETLPRN